MCSNSTPDRNLNFSEIFVFEVCKFCFTEYLPTEPVETHFGHNYVEIINQNFLNKLLLYFDRSLLYPVIPYILLLHFNFEHCFLHGFYVHFELFIFLE